MASAVPTSEDRDDPSLTVVDRIKSYILANRLSPGDPMPTEFELSSRLQVSRSRVREAIKTLSALDIVEVRHGYGTFVGRLSLTALVESLTFRGLLSASDDEDLLADLVDLREVIETGLAPTVLARIGPATIETLTGCTTAMTARATRDEEFAEEDRAFHSN